MKLNINFQALALAALTISGFSNVFVQGAYSGLRGGVETEKETNRNLQGGGSIRTPIVQNILDTDVNGGTDAAAWPSGRFANRPAISKFSFELRNGGDINLDQVRVDPTELGTFAAFHDRNEGEPFIYSVTGVELPPSTEYVLFAQRNIRGCFDSPPQPEVPGKVPVLQGFAVNYSPSNFDRNVQHLRVQVDTQQGTNRPIIRVCHADFNDDDPFNFAVRYALVDEALVFGFDEFGQTKVGGGVDASVTFDRPSNTVAIINGFDLEFLSGDRDIDKIQVEANQDGRLFVNFADQTVNDNYRWKVDLAYIGAE